MKQFCRCLALFGMVAMVGSAYAQCGSETSQDEVRVCLAQDLRDSDKRINAVYKLLMNNLSKEERIKLRNEQRGWLKMRDKACSLNNKESNREKWLQAILADQEKTVCVVRYTFTRVAELNNMLKQKAPQVTADVPAAPEAPQFSQSAQTKGVLPASLRFYEDGYQAQTAMSHERGKWYFEITLDRAGLAQMGDMLLAPGVFSSEKGVIYMVNIRRSQAEMGPVVIGFAVDLNGGFVYASRNGEWNVVPGAAGSSTLKLNTAYVAGIESSTEVRELIRRGLIEVNVGEQLFKNTMPSGYRAWADN